MKLTKILGLVGFVVSQEGTCREIYVRKNFNSLTLDQKNLYWTTFVELSKRIAEDGNSELHRFTKTHVEFAFPTHNNPFFLVWHRRFLLEFHNKMREIEPSVELPYWDWISESSAPRARDRVRPHNSPIMRFFFGNGEGPDNCVAGASELNITYKADDGPKCLQRKFDRGNSISPFSNQVGIDDVLSERDFNQFSKEIEASPHALPHINLGGDMVVMSSPNDPVFWLHHSVIDLLFAQWQQSNSIQDIESDRLGNPINLNSPIPVFGDSFESTLDTTKFPYCYTYDKFNQEPTQEPTQELNPGRAPDALNLNPETPPPVAVNQGRAPGALNPLPNQNTFNQEFSPGTFDNEFIPSQFRPIEQSPSDFNSPWDFFNPNFFSDWDWSILSLRRRQYEDENQTTNSKSSNSDSNIPKSSNPDSIIPKSSSPDSSNPKSSNPDSSNPQPKISPPSFVVNPIRNLELTPGFKLTVNLTHFNDEHAQSEILNHICPYQTCPSNVGNYQNYAIPRPASIEWMKKHHYPIDFFRDQELRHAQLTYQANKKFGSYINQPQTTQPRKCRRKSKHTLKY